ncbi:hypothetical protein ACJ72_01771 [Emergomyces africanus]|uniref:Uncharacterized protein n=1 Tax=Emergomyces africanus TaxID=1955775 RepID=A0A1B7P4C9_9EURO|nr:hypothetical protein ACJ72_01771 [Emergomyces africanus]
MATPKTASKSEQTQARPSSSSSSNPKPPSQQRALPPFFFQGPPSLNTSNLSLPPSLLPGSNTTAKPTSAASATHSPHPPPLFRQDSTRSIPPNLTATTGTFPLTYTGTNTTTTTNNTAPAPGSTSGSPLMRSSRFPGQGQAHGLGYGLAHGTGTGTPMGLRQGHNAHAHGEMDGSKASGGADALWQQMQNTLAEVELSAMNGDHVFGTQHAKALEELRDKQLALALAWARSEADEVVENPPADEGVSAAGTSATGVSTNNKGAGGTGAGVAAGGAPGGAGGTAGGADSTRNDSTATATDEGTQQKFMGEKTEKDILLARKRREANDRYFDRVNSGVLDVVAKLEEVALAMRVVERESKEIWNESGDDEDEDDGDVDGPSATASAAGSAAASTTTSRYHHSTMSG